MNSGTAWDISQEAWPPGTGVLTWPGSEAPPVGGGIVPWGGIGTSPSPGWRSLLILEGPGVQCGLSLCPCCRELKISGERSVWGTTGRHT